MKKKKGKKRRATLHAYTAGARGKARTASEGAKKKEGGGGAVQAEFYISIRPSDREKGGGKR